MSELLYCAKQASAMAEFHADTAKSKMDAAIDAEEAREELIAARAQEISLKRLTELAPIDIVAGLQSITEPAAAILSTHILAGDTAVIGVMARALIHLYIEQDSEVMAMDWMESVEKKFWSAQ